jgi:choice-of-anchor A domain-containing protein
MKRRLGPVSVVLTAVVLCILAASVPASAATTVDSFPLGTPFLYGEYAAGSSSVIGETVDGAAAYGGDTSITTSMVGASPASATAPGGVTMELGGGTNSVGPTTLAHGHGEYVGSFSGSGNAGPFTHVTSLPISFSAADSDLAAASSNFAALGVTNSATGTSTLNLTSSYPGIDVFGLTEPQLTAASNISVNAPAGAVVVVNVGGAAPLSLSTQTVTLELSLGPFGFVLARDLGRDDPPAFWDIVHEHQHDQGQCALRGAVGPVLEGLGAPCPVPLPLAEWAG